MEANSTGGQGSQRAVQPGDGGGGSPGSYVIRYSITALTELNSGIL